MPSNKRLTINQKNLIRRYLVWCYKSAKEELDKIDRYFTQFDVDNAVLKNLKKSKEYKKSETYRDTVDDFEKYMNQKLQNALTKKHSDDRFKDIDPKYQYIQNRYLAIENAIEHFLGKDELGRITEMYEAEMTRRIIQSTEH